MADGFCSSEFRFMGTQCGIYACDFTMSELPLAINTGDASLQIASVCAPFYYEANAFPCTFDWIHDARNIVLKNFLPPPPLKKKKTPPRRLFSNVNKLHFYGSRNLERFNFFIPGEYAGIKIFIASVYSQIIFFFFALYTLFSARFKSPSITP